MKYLLFAFLVFSNFVVEAQVWTPFNYATLNIYENPLTNFPKEAKVFSFHDNIVDGDDVKYSGYLTDSNQDADSSSCIQFYWTAHKLTHPWFGAQVISNDTNIRIKQASGDTLYFDLSSSVGDTLWMLNGPIRIYGVCNSHQSETVLGNLDEVVRFTLKHTDDLDVPISGSTIHDKGFALGRQLGFIDYFSLNSSGNPTPMMKMVGNREVDAGKHSLKKSDCYAFPIGSEYQIVEYVPDYPTSTSTYVRSEIVDLVDLGNSIEVTRNIETQTILSTSSGVTSVTVTIDSNVVDYRNKTELIQAYHYNELFEHKILSRGIYCDDTVFILSLRPTLVIDVCLQDSVIAYSEIQPFQSTHWQTYRQNQCYLHGFSPNSSMGGSYYMNQELKYLNTPSCDFGYPWYLDVNEIGLSFQLKYDQVSEGIFQFDQSYDEVVIYSLDGRLLNDLGAFTFELSQNTVFIAGIRSKGEWVYQKLSIQSY